MIVLLVLSLLLLLLLSLSDTHSLSLAHSESKKKTDENTEAQLTAWAVCAFALPVSFLFPFYILSLGWRRKRLMAKNSRPALTFYEMLSALCSLSLPDTL
jgi:hypothetical protein